MNRDDISTQEKLNELRLDILNPNSEGINFILVEGLSDIKLFRKLFSEEKCKVEIMPHCGKAELEKGVTDLIQFYPLIIGICDADFEHLNEVPYTKPHLFLTDYHDIEMTMIAQSVVLNALFCEFTHIPKNQHNQIKEDLLQSINMIGFLKWLNNKENLKLNFSKVGFQDLVCFETFTIDFSAYLKRVLFKSPNAKIQDIVLINQKITQLKQSAPDLMQLTNGHDLFCIFNKYFREKEKLKGCSDEHISRACRMTFNFESFKNTNLYQNLIIWAEQNQTELF